MATTEDLIIPFGKHKGETLGEILADDPTYLDWLNDRELTGALRMAVTEMCDKYAVEIERAIGEE